MSDAIKALAANMVGRKKTDPYILFLGAGASISSGCSSMMKIVDDVLESHDSTQFNDWQNEFKKANSIDAEFGELKKQEIDKQKRDRFFKIWSGLDSGSQYAILRRHLWEGKSPSDGYDDLAHLIKAGYIKMVLSTNLDNLLEMALTNAGWCQSDNFIVVVNGKDRSREVHEQLESPRDLFELIKLHGTLESPGSYAFTLDEVFDFEKIIKPSLSRIVNQSLIVVGHSMQDRDSDVLFDAEGGEIHFVNPSRPGTEDRIVTILRVRGQGSIIDGDNGKFDNFFRELCISINEISSKKQPNENKFVEEEESNLVKEVTTSNEFYKIMTHEYFIEDPFEKGEFEKKTENLFYFGEKTKFEEGVEDVIAKLYKYRILLITGKPRVGKTTFLLSFIDAIIKKRLGDFETIFFLDPSLTAEEFEKEVLDQIESKLEFREYNPNKVLLVIDGLRRIESDENYINKCKTLFKRVSDKGYRLIATLRDDQHETLKMEFSDREKWGTDKWANFRTEEMKIEPNFNNVKMILINYLNYYKDTINLNFSFSDPEFNSCVEIVANKTEGIIGDVVYLIEDLSISSNEASHNK